MFVNFWYAMAESSKVTADKPVQVRALMQDFVLFRDEQGKVHCLHDVCAHRGGALSHGKVKGNCVECPYHGWQFDHSGSCVKIPSLGPDNERISSRAKVDSYPTQEHYGLIFAFLGDLPEEQRPALMLPQNNPRQFDYSGPQWRTVCTSWPVNAYYERCMENGIDPAHNEFVHPRHGFSGKRNQYSVPEYEMVPHSWGGGWTIDFYAPPSTHEALRRTENARVKEGFMDVSAGFNGPQQLWTYIHMTPTNFMHQYIYETPIDESNTRAFLINLVNFVPEDVATNEELLDMNMIIAEDDTRVLEKLRPVKTPNSTSQEILVPADRAIVGYRRKLKEWTAKGWRIDTKAMAGAGSEQVYAIPSPRRREEQGWVFEAVPLQPGDAGANNTAALTGAASAV